MNTNIKKIELDEIFEEDVSFDKKEEFSIKYWSYSRSVYELYNMYINKEIIIPSLQREYVWNYDQASLFIDSILRGLPIPSFFVTEINNKYLIIDGLQRLHSLYLFIEGKQFESWKNNARSFRLPNKSKYLSSCRGKCYDEFSEDTQRKLMRAFMNVIEFSQISPSNNYSAMFQIFERINSTGRTLESQEVRNAAFYSKFNVVINDFTNYKFYAKLYNSKKDIYRTELSIRYLSIKALLDMDKITQVKKNINLKNLLNEYMAIFQAKENDLKIDHESFPYFSKLFETLDYDEEKEIENLKNCIDWIYEMIGENAFHNIKESKFGIEYKHTLQTALSESLLIAVSEYIAKNKTYNKDYRKLLDFVLLDDEFQDALSVSTTSFENIKKRKEMIISMFEE